MEALIRSGATGITGAVLCTREQQGLPEELVDRNRAACGGYGRGDCAGRTKPPRAPTAATREGPVLAVARPIEPCGMIMSSIRKVRECSFKEPGCGARRKTLAVPDRVHSGI